VKRGEKRKIKGRSDANKKLGLLRSTKKKLKGQGKKHPNVGGVRVEKTLTAGLYMLPPNGRREGA